MINLEVFQEDGVAYFVKYSVGMFMVDCSNVEQVRNDNGLEVEYE